MTHPTRRGILKIGLASGASLLVTGASPPSSPLASQPECQAADSLDKDLGMRELSEKTIRMLIEKAKAASSNAYCPYSKFSVGAAILTEDEQIFTGCNVENASYGLTICAERNAVFSMVAAGKKKLRAIVIYTPTPSPTAPCGACRQVLNEFGPQAFVLCICDGSAVIETNLSALLPDAFGPANLK